ncbi:MAG: hypothetical protein WCP69_09895 [Bacteroidota bacterium]
MYGLIPPEKEKKEQKYLRYSNKKPDPKDGGSVCGRKPISSKSDSINAMNEILSDPNKIFKGVATEKK